MGQNTIIIGEDARGHALGWKLDQSPHVNSIYHIRGNGGTPDRNVGMPVDQDNGFKEVIAFAKSKKALVVVSPEKPLSEGIVDALRKENIEIFGPTKEAAQIESSKVFAKRLMREVHIPTPEFWVFDNIKKAEAQAKAMNGHVVVKADGLAAGKGVIITDDIESANKAIFKIVTNYGFPILLEEKMPGTELSYIVITDGNSYVPLAAAQDYKQLYPGGPNTGGMGAYSPLSFLTPQLEKRIQKEIIEKTLEGMRRKGIIYTGFLYAGIALVKEEPVVYEFNARMGDPEALPILMRMNSDLYPYLKAAIAGKLHQMPAIEWNSRSAVTVVLAIKGYPGNFKKGETIRGLENVYPDSMIFHSGTKRMGPNPEFPQGKIVTDRGRVFGVTAMGDDIQQARNYAYKTAKKIKFHRKISRKDIALI